jgi:hypothetical protein
LNERIHLLTQFSVHSAVRIIRSMRVLFDNDASFDAAYLLRTLFEIVLTLRYAYSNMNDLDIVSGSLGILDGTYEYMKNKRGEPIENRLKRKSDGQVIEVPNRWTMANRTGEPFVTMYRTFYSTHCEITHNDVIIMREFLTRRGLRHLSPDRTLSHGLEALLLLAVLAQYIIYNSGCSVSLKKDLTVMVKKNVLGFRLFEKLGEQNRSFRLSDEFRFVVDTQFGFLRYPGGDLDKNWSPKVLPTCVVPG